MYFKLSKNSLFSEKLTFLVRLETLCKSIIQTLADTIFVRKPQNQAQCTKKLSDFRSDYNDISKSMLYFTDIINEQKTTRTTLVCFYLQYDNINIKRT